jgi:hypothetical protein
VALAAAAFNIVGGFIITDRMLVLLHRQGHLPGAASGVQPGDEAGRRGAPE